MQSRQVAAHRSVVEARRCERPLRMAFTAPRRQRVVVDVILAVAIEAEVAGSSERPRILVTALARDVVVHALERKIADIVQRLDVFKRARRVALLALRSVLTFVHLRLRVTAVTVGRPWFECDRWMAVGTPHFEVLTVEVKPRHRVVVKDVISGLDVTALAPGAESTFMSIVVFVATFGGAGRGGFSKFSVFGMAVFAFIFEVLSAQRKTLDRSLGVTRERLVVIEFGRVPRAADMAGQTRRAERAFVK